ncbi:hypothetical protein pdam_00012321, partial [Pocillopora damicornis]
MCADVLHLTYADDDVGNIESCLSEDLLSVDTWLNANKRTLNMTKSECPNCFPISHNERLQNHSGGVTTDEKLSWNCYIEKPTQKIASGIGAMKQPRLDYCSNVWGICGITLQDKRQKLQNRAACVLTLSNYDADAGRMVRNFGVENFDCWRNTQKGTLVFKCLHGLAPDNLTSKFSKCNTIYNLWDSENKLNVRLPRKNHFKNSFSTSFQDKTLNVKRWPGVTTLK